MRASIALLAATALAACGIAERPSRPSGRPGAPSNRETARCHVDLNRVGVRFSILPDRDYGAGCAIQGAVQLVDIGVPVTGIKAVRCGQARAFTGWIRNGVAPAAWQILGSELARVDTMGSYACRNVVGSGRGPARRSGHATANAIDFAGVVLKDGRRISILRDWNAPDPDVRRFVRTLHASACKRFGTVLSPDYNAAHRDHLHLEDDQARFCR